MAKVFASPIEAPKVSDFITAKPFSFDRDGLEAAEAKYTEDLRALLVKRKPGPYVGEIISFGIADGQALYMVASLRPAQLVHMPLGDAWQVSAAVISRLTVAQIKAQIDAEKLFDQAYRTKKKVEAKLACGLPGDRSEYEG